MSDSKASKAALKVLRQSNNEWSTEYFAISVGAIMLLFAVHHWSKVIDFRYGPRKKPFKLSKSGVRADRSLLYITYWAINLVLAVTNVDLTEVSYVAKRFGWISVANLVLLVFLALKNTPLAPLTGNSYEKLRPLHKVAGYTCIFTSVLHAIVYLSAWSETGKLAKMKKAKNYAGAIAGMAMVVIGLSTITYFTRRYYELVFYMLHILMFSLVMIAVGMHRPEFSSTTVIIVIFTASLWATDRIIRGAKILWNIFGNSATISALPNEAIRIRLNRHLPCSPGSHAFLWVPAVRWVESHPFTLVSSKPTEFIIRVYDGFTRDLYRVAQSAPGRSLRCSVDGPYGQMPNFKAFEKVVLVAGGSGASFTFAIALDLIQTPTKSTKYIDFIWAVRHHESLEWFAEELKIVQNSPDINLMIHVTNASSPPNAFAQIEKDITPMQPSLPIVTNDLEKGHLHESTVKVPFSADCIKPGRPDIENLIKTASNSQGNADGRVIVGACGPKELISMARNAVNNDVRDERLSVTLYTETSSNRATITSCEIWDQ
ncbi:FAD-binding 8 [Penicillium angulare]|uniref:ferric-chelate reductase (NADPH) n=1 Tax=Penicillium angulare TaxID=116970 RepID=A0A9W9FHW1_9EURO|nr:FAD-binding 8 [Penicillium angulare]